MKRFLLLFALGALAACGPSEEENRQEAEVVVTWAKAKCDSVGLNYMGRANRMVGYGHRFYSIDCFSLNMKRAETFFIPIPREGW